MAVKIRGRPGGKGYVVDVRVRQLDGSWYRERHRVAVTTRSAAQRWGQQLESAIIAQGGKRTEEKPEVPAPTLAQFWPRFIEGHSLANREKPSSVDSKQRIYRTRIAPRFAQRQLDAISDEDIQTLKAELRHLSVKSVNNTLTVLGKLLKVAVEWNVLERMPCRVKLLKAALPSVEFYEPEVYEGLVEAAANVDLRVHLVVLLGGDAGLRLGEIIGLEWHDVDFRRGLLQIRRAVWEGQVSLPKGGKERVVPMTARLSAALQAHRHLRALRVLLKDEGLPVDRAWIAYGMRRAQRRANMVEDGRVHILRHTFCSRLAMLDVPAMSIKELAGHANLQTTQRYLHLSSKAKGTAIRALDGAIESVATRLATGLVAAPDVSDIN